MNAIANHTDVVGQWDVTPSLAKIEKAFADAGYPPFVNTPETPELVAGLERVMKFASSLVGGKSSDDAIVPMMEVTRKDGDLAIVAVPEMLHEDVRVRRAMLRMMPNMLKSMDAKSALLAREAWTIELNVPDGVDIDDYRKTVAGIRPSQDERRVSVVLVDLITPSMQTTINYKINEKAERTVNVEPLSVYITKHDGEMKGEGYVDLWPKEATSKLPEDCFIKVGDDD